MYQLLAVSFFSFKEKRYSSALFWLSYGLIFLLGDFMPPALVGGLVVLMALVAGFGGVLTQLTTEQASYLGVQVEGPFKSETYKY